GRRTVRPPPRGAARRRQPAAARQQPQRPWPRHAPHYQHPAGDQGVRRPAGRNRRDVMASALDLTASLQAASSKATPKPSAAHGDVARARKTAEDFATFFFSQSLESVFSNMGADKMFGGGS